MSIVEFFADETVGKLTNQQFPQLVVSEDEDGEGQSRQPPVDSLYMLYAKHMNL